jgi:hypothetical protein
MVMKPRPIPDLPRMRCTACGAHMMPGFPVGTPTPQNVTTCPSCEAEYIFDADVDLRPLVLAELDVAVRAHAVRMIDLARACQGKKPKKR